MKLRTNLIRFAFWTTDKLGITKTILLMSAIIFIAKGLFVCGGALVLALVIKGIEKGRKRKVPFYDYTLQDWRTIPDPEFNETNGQRS